MKTIKLFRPPEWSRKAKWAAGTFVIFTLLAFTGFMIIFTGGYFIVSEEKLVLNSATTIETKDGQIIERMYTENRTLISLEDIPEHVKQAFIAVEDERFYQHEGLDPKAILRAVYRDIIAMGKVEGGSTITQQLVKNLFLTNDKSWMRKTKEVMAAIYLERHYSKDKILELYLNTIYFGKGVYGVEEAAKTYFNTSVRELSISQGALLAGLPKAPNNYSPFENPKQALERRNIVLSRMEAADVIEAEEMVSLQGATLGVERGEENTETWSNSYVDAVISEAAKKYNISRDELKRGGYQIIVEIDPEIQKLSARHMKEGKFAPGSNGKAEGAFTLMDQATGAYKAIVGGRDYKHGQTNHALTRKQPGSVIKPLAVYGPALMDKKYIPYSLLVDEKQSYGGYTPTNYDGQYDGMTSIYKAIVDSKNAPAVWLLDQMGISYSKEYLDKLGLPTEDEGLAIALGGLSKGYTPMQLTEAYRTFANNGKQTDGHTIEKIIDRNGRAIHEHKQSEKQVFNQQTAWEMTQILETTVDSGTAQAGSYSKALAGKTGTQQHPTVEGQNKDVWFTGYTPDYVGTLWMGYDSSAEDSYLTGGSEYPTALMKTILSDIDEKRDLLESFKKPEGQKELPVPITLPEITDASGSGGFGGWSLFSDQITWTPGEDKRVIYRIYRLEEDSRQMVGRVTGKGEVNVSGTDVFGETSYVVVPFDPLTGLEGEASNVVTIN
ncbi:transglycosylase domain-containing protein [Halobacillus sp. Marseille-Q1614]|uniref:transglycosylase domain-containing protein n=1 Tax=Halobacillus sp. Marseille-Q1614 TaxID=2709134 RepID=UPI0020C3C8CB|nr:PBP1A family penicillin-binding protein [Halobacillus sp. Marseille-Q1614]